MRDIKGKFVKNVTLEDIKEGRVAIHTPTQVAYNLVDNLHDKEYLISYKDWEKNKEDTVLRCEYGFGGVKGAQLWHDCPIIPFSEVEHLFVKSLNDKEKEFWEYVLSDKALKSSCRGNRSYKYCITKCPYGDKDTDKCLISDIFEGINRGNKEEMQAMAKKLLGIKDPKVEEALPEPVSIEEIIASIETEKTFWALCEEEGLEIFKVYLDQVITDVTKETFDDSRKAGVPWDSVYRTLEDAVKVAKIKGWE